MESSSLDRCRYRISAITSAYFPEIYTDTWVSGYAFPTRHQSGPSQIRRIDSFAPPRSATGTMPFTHTIMDSCCRCDGTMHPYAMEHQQARLHIDDVVHLSMIAQAFHSCAHGVNDVSEVRFFANFIHPRECVVCPQCEASIPLSS